MSVNKILKELQKGAVQVANLLQKRDVEYTKDSNASGDNQLKVDVLADRLFADILGELNVKGYASEEQEKATYLGRESRDYGKALREDSKDSRAESKADSKADSKIDFQSDVDYNISDLLVAYDPLDGSSLVDSNLTIGSIFGIYLNDFSGSNLIASAYFLYGPRLEMVAGVNHKSLHFVYNYVTHAWDFVQEIRLKDSGKINAPGGTQKFWSKKHKALIESFFADGYRLRYSGGMVADLHQILCKGGGIFSYPATSDSPQGKLRQLFEVFPFALIFEHAGGGAINENERILNINTPHIHATTPCYFGSRVEIQKILNG
ncbi:fructose-bisphosphatase class I [Helicobacter saguini]|uniref:Fructose-1,6-bisphosphatase class 1 n=1 Tax=Helicobacter saguini TaxID=1548018 RepID=A0A347VN24_9HELI|nr:class 1 fructose-bisphosphatase [Helicobacter saguini]MWV61931.1 fructose-bisphosphatase class I [Helicobacter saguini]MWV67394.1 fructose-bisphosphatase class I [Helicobacter saguini]MWV69747.1 fructose-bisphosphatase class I [Helicobacter saguini]MWV73036.1 fructose-bisphosphatase class I [Helicobacter saguini]TLD95588.1 fructose-1,6-bisphosphatase [Helicobacter saguini]